MDARYGARSVLRNKRRIHNRYGVIEVATIDKSHQLMHPFNKIINGALSKEAVVYRYAGTDGKILRQNIFNYWQREHKKYTIESIAKFNTQLFISLYHHKIFSIILIKFLYNCK